MKKLLLTPILAALILGSGGCASTSDSPPAVSLEKVVSLIKAVVSNGALYLMQKEDKAEGYFRLFSVSLNVFIIKGDYDVSGLQAAMNETSIKELKDGEIKLAITTFVSLYELYIKERVSNKISKNEKALVIITAIQDGLSIALSAHNPTPVSDIEPEVLPEEPIISLPEDVTPNP